MNQDSGSDVADFVLAGFRSLLNLKYDSIANVGVDIPIPSFEAPVLVELCEIGIKVLKSQPSLLRINNNTVVVGDLHGSLLDLIRIFSVFGEPPATRYLFLGDYVDRGPFSLEVITMLVAYQCAFPEHVFLLRGNHELAHINSMYGFKIEIILGYGFDDIWKAFQKYFEWLPIAAVVGNNIFCVHGGLSPLLKKVEQIEEIERPLADLATNQLALDLLWADPSLEFVEFSESKRGVASTFGASAVSDFLASSGMKWIVRAHQCVNEGIALFPNGSVVTVFTSSNYTAASKNKAGVLFINERNELEPTTLNALRKIKRDEVCFFTLSRSTVSLNNELTAVPSIRTKSKFVRKKDRNMDDWDEWRGRMKTVPQPSKKFALSDINNPPLQYYVGTSNDVE